MRLCTLLALALAALACGRHSILQVSPPLTPLDPQRAALAGDERIFISDGDVDAECRPLAVVRTNTYRREEIDTEGMAELRAQAQRLGADGVIRVQARPELIEELAHRPGSLPRIGTQWVTVYRLSGIAVSCDDPPAVSTLPGLFGLNLPPER